MSAPQSQPQPTETKFDLSKEKNVAVHLKRRPVGLPKDSDIEYVTSDIVMPKEDGEIVVRMDYLSVDPTHRIWMGGDSYLPAVPLGDVMRAGGVATVVASNNAKFPVGQRVRGLFGVQKYALVNPNKLPYITVLPPLDSKDSLPLNALMDVLGSNGMTAYFGLLDICKPKKGETLVISAASGSVGSAVGQLGKIVGCRVVGLAGSDDKCKYITQELGFDAAINYKTHSTEAKLTEALKQACPQGIDIYFDNVGGMILNTIFPLMNNEGRIPFCGAISQYNEQQPQGPSNYHYILFKRLLVKGFIVLDFAPRFQTAFTELSQWYKEGKLKCKELDVSQGIESYIATLCKLFDGSNTGKLAIKF